MKEKPLERAEIGPYKLPEKIQQKKKGGVIQCLHATDRGDPLSSESRGRHRMRKLDKTSEEERLDISSSRSTAAVLLPTSKGEWQIKVEKLGGLLRRPPRWAFGKKTNPTEKYSANLKKYGLQKREEFRKNPPAFGRGSPNADGIW